MAVPNHYLHMYQKPAEGTAFIARYVAYKYKHKISANGWFDTMSCALAVTQPEAEILFEQAIGNRVSTFVDNPIEPIFEGIISRVTYNAGGVSFTSSMDEMMNRVTVRTTMNDTTGTLTDEESGEANDTASQAAFGIKAGVIDGGATWNGSVQTAYMQAMRDSELELRAWPMQSIMFGGANAIQAFITIEVDGFFHMLEAEETTTQTNAQADTTINNVLSNLVNGNTFIDTTDTTDIDTNATFNYRPREASALTAWEVFKQIQEAGDSSGNLWVTGVTPTDIMTGTRRLYYRQADTSIKYVAYRSDAMRLRNRYGGLVKAWDVRPDGGVRIQDILIGWDSAGNDPREFYIAAVDYDADTGRAQLRGVDDIHMENQFQLDRRSRIYNRRGAAGQKQVQLS